jgi:hypothetical protein
MRPAAQERWIVCYDLEYHALNVFGYSELMLEPEYREKLPEIVEKLSKSAKSVLELVQLLRFSGILEAETPTEILQRTGWPEISPSLRQAARKNKRQ